MFNKLAIVSIPVNNQDISKKFYMEVLGCKLMEEMPMGPTARWIRLEFPGVETRIVLVTWFPQMQPGSLQGLVLITNDIAKTCADLKLHRVSVSEISKKPYGLEASFSDPDGNGWVLQQPA